MNHMDEQEKKLALIILNLINKYKILNKNINKDLIQIIIYFYQLIIAPLGYNYEIYNYTIRCKKLDDHIDNLDIMGAIKNIKQKDTIDKGPGINSSLENEIESYNADVDKIFIKLETYDYSELEPMAFLHFITKTLKDNYNATEKNRFIDEFMKIKLNIPKDKINSIYDEMVKRGII